MAHTTLSPNHAPYKVLPATIMLIMMLAVASCRHGGMTEQAARAAVDTVEAHYNAYATTEADLPLIADADRQLSVGIGGSTSIWATASSSALMVA